MPILKRLIISSLLIIALSTSLLSGGCEKNQVAKKGPIRIGLSVEAGYAVAFIAKKKDFFKKNNIEVELVLKRDITDVEDSYRYGEVDGLFGVFSSVIIINGEGLPTKTVYVVDYSDSLDVIIGKPEFKSLKDLKGETIGVERMNGFSHYFILKLLERAGVKESEIYFKIVPAMDTLTALDKGIIAAGHTWEPVKSQALKKGYKVLGKAGDIPGLITDILAFNARVIKQRPDDIQNIVKSFSEAIDFVHSNREESIEIMSKALGMTKEEMSKGIDAIILPNLNANVKAMQQTGDKLSLYSSYKDITDFYLERGQISSMPHADDVIEPQFVTYLNEEGKNR